MSLKKVSMNLTERDVINTELVKDRLHTRNKAEAVSAALSIVSSLTENIGAGEDLYIVSKDGKTSQKVIIPGLNK